MSVGPLAVMASAAIGSCHTVPHVISSSVPLRGQPPFMMNRWADAQRRRREEEEARYELLAKARAEQQEARQAKAEAERLRKEQAAAQRSRAMAEFQDDLDVFRPGDGARQPVPIITRESLANAQKTSSPALEAEERLAAAMKEVSSLNANAACDMLKQRIAAARAAGLREEMPNFKKARALLITLEAAAASLDGLVDGGVGDESIAAPDASIM